MNTTIHLLQAAQPGGDVVVDGVCEVVPLPLAAIRAAPGFVGSGLETRYITGLATVDGRVLILPDIDGLMTGADMALVDEPCPATTVVMGRFS